MKGELDRLIQFVGKLFVFDEKKYPELTGASDKERFDYGVRHSALHLAKFGGKVAAVSEDVDHGGEGDIEELRKAVPRLLITVLKLADLLGMSEADLIRAIEEKYKQTLNPD